MASVTPVEIARVPLADGAVELSIHDVSVPTAEGALPCWGFVTHGLMASEQREVVFVLRRRSDEAASDYPQMILQLFALIHGYAVQGQRWMKAASPASETPVSWERPSCGHSATSVLIPSMGFHRQARWPPSLSWEMRPWLPNGTG